MSIGLIALAILDILFRLLDLSLAPIRSVGSPESALVVRLHFIIHPAGVLTANRTLGAPLQTALARGRDIQAFSDRIAVIAFAPFPFLKSFPRLASGTASCASSGCEEIPLPALRQRHVGCIRPLKHRDHEHREGPGHGGYRLPLGDLGATDAHAHAFRLEICVGHAFAHDPLGALHKKPPHERRTGLCDVALPVHVPRLRLLRDEPKPRTDIPRLGESVHISPYGRDKSGRDHDADTVYLHKTVYHALERGGGGKLPYELFVGPYRDRQLGEVLDHWPGDVAQLLRPGLRVQPVELCGGAFRKPEAHGFRDRAQLDYDPGALLHEEVAHLVDIDHLLVFRAAELYGMQKLRICERDPCQKPGVVRVILGLGGCYDLEAIGVREIHLEAESRGDVCASAFPCHDADLRLPVAHIHSDYGIMSVVHLVLLFVGCLCTTTVASALQTTF